MTALMSVFREYPERTAGYITDCRRMGIGVLRPSVNKSGLDFTIEASSDSPEAIRYGLGGSKIVGDGEAAHIVEARELKGEFSDVVDFMLRVDLRRVGKRALESLIKAGALDDFGPRSALLDQIDQLTHDSGKHHQALSAGQMKLFAGESNGISTNHPPDQPMDVSKRQQLAWEREFLGTYVSDQPIAPKMDILDPLISHYGSEIQDASQNERVIVAGEVTKTRTILTRRDEQMAFVSLEDLRGEISLVVFPKLWAGVSEWMEEGLIVVAKGKVDQERGDPKVLVDKITDQIERVKLGSSISVKRKKEV